LHLRESMACVPVNGASPTPSGSGESTAEVDRLARLLIANERSLALVNRRAFAAALAAVPLARHDEGDGVPHEALRPAPPFPEAVILARQEGKLLERTRLFLSQHPRALEELSPDLTLALLRHFDPAHRSFRGRLVGGIGTLLNQLGEPETLRPLLMMCGIAVIAFLIGRFSHESAAPPTHHRLLFAHKGARNGVVAYARSSHHATHALAPTPTFVTTASVSAVRGAPIEETVVIPALPPSDSTVAANTKASAPTQAHPQTESAATGLARILVPVPTSPPTHSPQNSHTPTGATAAATKPHTAMPAPAMAQSATATLVASSGVATTTASTPTPATPAPSPTPEPTVAPTSNPRDDAAVSYVVRGFVAQRPTAHIDWVRADRINDHLVAVRLQYTTLSGTATTTETLRDDGAGFTALTTENL